MGMAPRKPAGLTISRASGLPVGIEGTTRATRLTTQADVAAFLENGSSNPTGRIRAYVEYGIVGGAMVGSYHSKWETVTATTWGRTLYGLQPNTNYWVRVMTQGYTAESNTIYADGSTHQSAFATGYFLTDRPPAAEATAPANDSQFAAGANFVLRAQTSDPDDWSDTPPFRDTNAVQFRIRRKATPKVAAGEWSGYNAAPDANGQAVLGVGSLGLPAGNSYEWQVAAGDGAGLWSPWSALRTFHLTAPTAPPTLLSPSRGQGVSEAGPIVFRLRHRTPTGQQMVSYSIYARVKGETDWTWIDYSLVAPTGTNGEGVYIWGPGSSGQNGNGVTAPKDYTFKKGFQYEWTARTTDALGLVSDKAQPLNFYVTAAPGSAVPPEITDATVAPSLGIGVNRAFVYERGGEKLLGEITPLVKIKWGRMRDDISECSFTIEDFEKSRDLLANLRSWQHEIVVFRDNGLGVERVWEGPVTHIEYQKNRVIVQAKDVMAYVYRRIMRLGYNDSYQLLIPGYWDGKQYIDGWGQQGLRSVVLRAEQILINALGYDDPNVLQYLTAMTTDHDTIQARIVQAYSKSAWQEVDDLAAKAGLDYTTVGRRILLWDTHEPVGRLPEMTDGDFGDSPIVTEYGMQLATDFAVTNNNGVYGISTKDEGHEYYGFVEQIASAYSESEASGGTAETLTAEAQQALEATLTGQAQRNIASRYPTPLIVRVPDNTTLDPELNLGINQLVPGVYVPLRATGTLRTVTQMQKMDAMTCEQTSKGETITVTLSPAPGTLGVDPDAGGTDVPSDE